MTAPNSFQILRRPLGESNYWRQDPVLQDLLARLLPRDLDWIRPRLEQMGAQAASEVDALARVADRLSPVHRPYDAFGRRIDAIDYHPCYRQMERVAYGSGMVGLKYDLEVRSSHPTSAQVMGFALGYLFAQAESGLFCPVCMTDGVARVVELVGTEEQKRRVVPRLAARDVERLWRGAMFLTEKQGGSDVGAVATRAVRDGEGWRLYGEKWFCSNVDAEAVLALARPEGAPSGTRGLGLFLVLRELPDGRRNAIRIDRIKDKLGVRSMPTGEVTFEGAVAEAVGPLEAGFKSMAEMLNLSRLYNAVASIAIARRAIHEATQYLRARDTFGQPAISHPLVREMLADLNAEEIAAKHLVFNVVEYLDRGDAGSANDARRARVLIPLAKLTTAKLAVWAASEAIELLGGNGYIEEFVTARLLRDAQVLPVWEGTTNILRLDVLRVCRKERAVELVLADVRARCEGAAPALADEAGRIARLAAELAREAPEIAAAEPQRQASRLRRWVDRLALAYSAGLLLEAANPKSATGPVLAAAVRRLLQRHLDESRAIGDGDLSLLVDSTVAR